MMKKDSVADPVMETLLNRYPGLASCAEEITEAYQILRDSIGQGGTVFVCGKAGGGRFRIVRKASDGNAGNAAFRSSCAFFRVCQRR